MRGASVIDRRLAQRWDLQDGWLDEPEVSDGYGLFWSRCFVVWVVQGRGAAVMRCHGSLLGGVGHRQTRGGRLKR